MKYGIKGFSLIEVVIATSIISISVFGIYKLIGENTKIINNSSDYLQVNSLFPILENCIENIGSSIIGAYSVDTKIDFNLGNTGSLNECKINGTDKVIIDDVEYELSSIIKNKTSEYIELELQISSEKTKTMTGYYKQIKNPNF